MSEQNVEKREATPQEYAEALKRFDEEWGYTVVPTIRWIRRDDGSWSTLAEKMVEKIEKPK